MVAVGGLASALANNIQDLLPLQKGYVVASCFSSTTPYDFTQDPDGFVVMIFDSTTGELANAGTGLSGGSYAWRRFHNEVGVQNPNVPSPSEEWTAGNLGEVFGITLDDAANPNIYVAASTVYGVHAYPAGNHSGTVYRLDGTTGAITPFNCIPAGNASLGNLTHWRSANGGHLYVSNLDDGLIYQLDLNGDCVGTFDHGVNGRPNESQAVISDDASVNFTQVGRRIWGLEAHEGRLYYGVWTSGNPEIWSVALDGSGTPQPATAQMEIPATSFVENYPVSDIAFSTTGQLYTAHRYHRAVPFGGPHQATVYEFTLSGSSWDNPSPANTNLIGNYSQNTNNAGGVGVNCDGSIWATADAINLTAGNIIYGAQRIPAGGNTGDVPAIVNSHIIDFDCTIDRQLKNYMGDIEPYDPCDECFDITDLEIECPTKAGDPYLVTFKITNRSDQTAHYIWHTPCPKADLPQDTLTGQPTTNGIPPVGPQPLPVPLAPGDCTTVTVNLPAPNTGGTFCWNITLLTETGDECCTDKICVDLPDCDCFVVLDKSIECIPQADGTFKYVLDIKVVNTSTFDWHHVNLLPPSFFTQANFALAPNPVAIGDTYNIHTCVIGQPGDKIVFSIAVHSEDIELCCSKECCIILPECEGQKKDGCELTRVAPCCPTPGAPPSATAVLTICNNSPVARTYSYNLTALPPGPGCDGILALGAAAFSPPNGTINVPPNGCVNIPITINCEGLQPGQRACYEACVRQIDNPANRFCCDALVYAPADPDPVIKADPDPDQPGGVILDPRGIASHKIEVSNPSDRAVTYWFEARSLGDAVEISSASAMNEGFNTQKRFRVDLEPFETEIVSMDLRGGPGVDFNNTMIPVMLYPLGPNGEVQPTQASFMALAPVQREGAPVLKGIASNLDGSFSMTLGTIPGASYRIESSETLGEEDAWGPVTCSTVENGHPATEFTANSSILVLRITPDPECPTNFFRAVRLP